MKLTMKKTAMAVTMGLAFGAAVPAANASLVLTFANGTATAAKSGACSGISWLAGREFRMCDPSGAALGGGAPLQKDTIIGAGAETYSFDDTGVMTGVTGTPGNPGTYYSAGAAPTPGSNPTWQQNASFFGPMFNFLAPFSGSLAGTAYGAATYTAGVPVAGTNVPFIFAPVMEAQWGGTYFPLGSSHSLGGDGGLDGGLGVTFYADITNVVTTGLVTTFDFHLFANEKIDGSEDPGAAGFTGWTAQWHQQGSGTYTAVPVPAAVWLFGSGLLGLVGIARRKKTA